MTKTLKRGFQVMRHSQDHRTEKLRDRINGVRSRPDPVFQSVASTTFKRPDLKKAFEADDSYYIEHAELIRPKEEVDLATDPPPDLVIEVEITTSAIAKLKLFAAMGVPEVWRHDGETLQIFTLQDERYNETTHNKSLPELAASTINAFLAKRFTMGKTALIREFRGSIEA